MRIEITPVYELADGEVKTLVSVRKRIYLEDETMFAEWLLDWADGTWRRIYADIPWSVTINDEMRERLGWKEASNA